MQEGHGLVCACTLVWTPGSGHHPSMEVMDLCLRASQQCGHLEVHMMGCGDASDLVCTSTAAWSRRDVYCMFCRCWSVSMGENGQNVLWALIADGSLSGTLVATKAALVDPYLL